MLASVSYPEIVGLEALAEMEFNKTISGREQRQGVKVVPNVSGPDSVPNFKVATESVPEILGNFLNLKLLSAQEDFIVS